MEEENLLDTTKLKRQHTETTVTNSPLSTTTTTAMTSVEHPLKKRKLHDSPPSQSPQPETSSHFLQTLPTPPLSPDEILAKRRNKDAIRNLYEGYKRIKRCILQKQSSSMPDLDQNFLALIASSRGNRFSSFLFADFVLFK